VAVVVARARCSISQANSTRTELLGGWHDASANAVADKYISLSCSLESGVSGLAVLERRRPATSLGGEPAARAKHGPRLGVLT
jgi:hypothetical protein